MLEIRNLGVRYGRHLALEGVSAKVEKGEICVILGANGAGKSSLLKAVAGMVKAEAGSEIVMNGRPIAGMKPHRIVEEGIALVPEGRGIFGDLTVAENLQLGAFARRARNQEAATLARIYELFPRLAERKGQAVRTMSGGEQQMVAIGRALMSKPEILMLDEPSLGLSPLLCKELFKSLTAVAKTGVGILLVEQNAKQSLKIADRGYLIENGLVTGENTAAALAKDPAVVNAYLGGGAEGRQVSRSRIRLPAPFALPASLAAMGRFLGDLASRAGAIQRAFIRSIRRDGPLPSAFVGRFDPAGGGDPWETISVEVPKMSNPQEPSVSPQARSLSVDAARLAEAAGERYRRHIRSTRLSSARPSAFAHVPAHAKVPAPVRHEPAPQAEARPAVAQPARPAPFDAAVLARRATERLADHMRRQREASPLWRAAPHQMPAAPVPAERAAPSPRDERQPLDAAAMARTAGERMRQHVERQRRAAGLGAMSPFPVSRPAEPEPALAEPVMAVQAPLIGHNSAGFDIDGEDDAGLPTNAGAPSGSLDFADLAARAASIQAAHMANRRKALTAHVFRVGTTHNTDPGPDGRNSHKEA